jgi:hypothetical protein
MESKLWHLTHDKADTGKNARVFCNSFGCLCYLEGEDIRSFHARNPLGHDLGLKQSDVFAEEGFRRQSDPQDPVPSITPQWELIVIKHPAPDRLEANSGTDRQARR